MKVRPCLVYTELKDFLQHASLFIGQKILHSTKLSCVGSCRKHFFAFNKKYKKITASGGLEIAAVSIELPFLCMIHRAVPVQRQV